MSPIWASFRLLALNFSFMASLSAAISSTKNIECFGDSLTAGYMPSAHHFGVDYFPYGDSLRMKLASLGVTGVSVHHQGFPGYTTSQLMSAGDLSHRLNGGVKGGVDLVVLLAGTNDLAHLHPTPGSKHPSRAEEIGETLWQLHVRCHEAGAKTLAIAIPGSRYQQVQSQARDLAKEVNSILRKRCSGSDKCFFFDWPEAIDFKPNEGPGSLWNRDGLHMTEGGYRELGYALAPEISKILELASDSKKDVPKLSQEVSREASSTAAAAPAPRDTTATSSTVATEARATTKKKRLFPGAQKAFPEHWGAPPLVQTRDYRPWPGGYGAGSGTVAKWIAKNIEKDKQNSGRH